MVRATGIQFPINDGMTIPLYGKTFHVLTIAHITTNNNKKGIVNWLDRCGGENVVNVVLQ